MVAKWLLRNSSNSTAELNDSAAGCPTPIRCGTSTGVTPASRQAAANGSPVFPRPGGVEHHSGLRPAAIATRRRPGRFGVTMLAEGESDTAPGMSGPSERTPSPVRISVGHNTTARRPLSLADVPAQRLGALRADLSGLVVDRECFARATGCYSAIIAVTV